MSDADFADVLKWYFRCRRRRGWTPAYSWNYALGLVTGEWAALENMG